VWDGLVSAPGRCWRPYPVEWDLVVLPEKYDVPPLPVGCDPLACTSLGADVDSVISISG